MSLTPDQITELKEKISSAANAAELEVLELSIFGRKQGLLTAAMKEMGNLSPDERAKRGQEMNRLKQELTDAVSERRNNLGNAAMSSLSTDDRLDVTLELPPRETGHLHPIPEFINQVIDVFGRMGFEVADGPEVDTEEHNFDKLNFGKGHAARDAQDIFYLNKNSDPENKWLLRGHTSTVQVRYMETHKPPFRIICPGKVYRKDADATHSPMFHQFEGLMIGEDVNLANMKAVMMTAVRELVSPNVDFRFRTGYFPFVEPGLEMDLRWQGDESKSREGRWLEVAGCGVVHPNVLENCGIDSEKFQGFAFGFGVERMIMIRNQIPDLRSFYTGDLRFLRQF